MSTNTNDELNNELFIEELNDVNGGDCGGRPLPDVSQDATSRCMGEEGGGISPPMSTFAMGEESGSGANTGWNTGITGGIDNINNHVPPPVLR